MKHRLWLKGSMHNIPKLKNYTDQTSKEECTSHSEEKKNELWDEGKSDGGSYQRRLPENRGFQTGFCRLNRR